MSRKALVLLVCCCDFRDGAERLIPSKSLGNAVIRAFPGLFRILRMCAPRRAAAVVQPRERKKSADRRRRILISRLLIIRASVPRRKSPFPAYFKGFPAVSPLIPPYPAFLKYPVSPQVYKRMPVRTFYLLTCFLSAGVFAVLLLTPSLAVQRVLLVLLGLLQGAEVPALVILCCETFPTRTASASSIIVLGVSLSALIAPTVLGRLIEQVGYGIPLWGLTACLPLSAAVLLAIRRDAPVRA